jgi:O-antigen/teichoic acid export membrane protein
MIEESDQDFHPGLSRNVAVAMLANILYMASRLALPPIILSYISLEEYGIWSYCFVLIGYLSMTVFGFANVYVRYGAVYKANQEIGQMNRLVSTGLLLVSGLSILFLGLIALLLPSFLKIMNTSADLLHTAFVVLFLTSAIFLVDVTFGAFSSLLQSMRLFVVERSIWCFSAIMEALFIVLFFWMGFGIYSLVYAYAGRTLLTIALSAWACYSAVPTLSIHPRNFDKTLLLLFWHFGGTIQLTGIVSTINKSIEKVFAGAFLGPSATALYEVGEKFPITATYLPGSMNMVFFPTTAHLHATENIGEIEKIYVNGARWVNILTGTMMGFMGPFAEPIVRCWLGPDPKYYWAAVIMGFFTIAYQMDVVTGPASAIYRGINRPLRELFYPVLQFVLVIAAAIILFASMGASILTINISVAVMMVVSACIYMWVSNRYMGISQTLFFKHAILPGILPYAVGFILYLAFKNWFPQDRGELLLALVLCLTVYALITSGLIYFLLCGREERRSIHQRLEHVFGDFFRKKKN